MFCVRSRVNGGRRVIYKKNVIDFGVNKWSENRNEGVLRELEVFNWYIIEFSGVLYIRM